MREHGPIHWSAYVSCAVAGVVAIGLLIVSSLMRADALGRWGLLCGLLGAVIAAAIIADRLATRLAVASDARAAGMLTELETMLARHAGEVMKTYESQTEEIAHAVCDAVMDVFDSRRANDVRHIRR